MTAVSARSAYPQWAPTYERETVVSALEELTVRELGVATRGLRLLDVGAGTGRRLRDADASLAVGIDLVPEMIGAGGEGDVMIAGDAHALPFASGSFNVIWCRLMIGHVAEIRMVFAELARVCARGGRVVVTDLAPAAYAAGHRRTFRSPSGERVEIEHFVHGIDALCRAAEPGALYLARTRLGVVDQRLRQQYVDAGAAQMFNDQRGTELVHALVFEKA